MTPIEIAARAAWNLHHPPKPWEEVPEIIRKGKIREQAAALLVLAQREIPIEHIKAGSQAIDWGGELCEDADVLFQAICRSIATEGKDNG